MDNKVFDINDARCNHEDKDKVFLVVEHQSVIACEGWELKMDAMWGRETPLALAVFKPCCSVRVRFVDSLVSHNFRPDIIN